jgi:hypothetical protein
MAAAGPVIGRRMADTGIAEVAAPIADERARSYS